MKKLIFYTDLDGTLLNHHDYSWRDAMKTIIKLKNLGFPIVFNTSKTFKEVQNLQLETNIHDPFIIENGGAAWIPDQYFIGEPGRLVVLGQDLQSITSHLATFKQKYSFESFSDMSVQKIAKLTSLSIDKAFLSSQRLCSEPFTWQGTELELNHFHLELKQLGLNMLKGGRFYHVTGSSGKGEGLNFIQQFFNSHDAGCQNISIALGDSPNDLSMLAQADIAVVIPRADSSYINPQNSNIIKAEHQGARGWSLAVEKILTEHFSGSFP